jgi:hypothetical protein
MEIEQVLDETIKYMRGKGFNMSLPLDETVVVRTRWDVPVIPVYDLFVNCVRMHNSYGRDADFREDFENWNDYFGERLEMFDRTTVFGSATQVLAKHGLL